MPSVKVATASDINITTEGSAKKEMIGFNAG